VKVLQMLEEDSKPITDFAEQTRNDGLASIVVLGMGGSSLAPEVLEKCLGYRAPVTQFTILDTTDPVIIREVTEKLEFSQTLFVVSSKSGSTIETMSLLDHFWALLPDGDHYVAITDPGTTLDQLAMDRGFRKTFWGRPDVGGRYSALTCFGLVPAALAGVDTEGVLEGSRVMHRECQDCVATEDNPGAWLGALLGEAALAGQDKLTLLFHDPLAPLGAWIEQLIAESTGKAGRGIVPVDGEKVGPAHAYGSDRIFVAMGEQPEEVSDLRRAGHPFVQFHSGNVPAQIGKEFVRWMFSTALAGHVLKVNPFDEPNVKEAKDATLYALSHRDEERPTLRPIGELMASVRSGDYVAILVYVTPDANVELQLDAVRTVLREQKHVPTTLGYGPRYLHSTGQLHKGGPNTGVFIQVVEEAPFDLQIPGRPFTFGTLRRAQADGDMLSLLRHGRRVARVSLNELMEATR
jgi:hypothetical protein